MLLLARVVLLVHTVVSRYVSRPYSSIGQVLLLDPVPTYLRVLSCTRRVVCLPEGVVVLTKQIVAKCYVRADCDGRYVEQIATVTALPGIVNPVDSAYTSSKLPPPELIHMSNA
jgi:hypothetical protein